MNDFFFRIRLLPLFLIDGFKSWKYEMYRRELDEYYCCNGHECGCGGVTVREMYKGKDGNRQ